MKSLVWLTESILRDSGIRCGADPSRDIQRVYERTENEGESFLTITLPNYGQCLDRAIAHGQLRPSDTPGFAWHKRGLPEFLRGFLSQIFSLSGSLLPEPSHEAILCVRQICLTHKKILRECTEKRSRKALDSFRKCDDEVVSAGDIPKVDLDRFRNVSRIVWNELLSNVPNGDVRGELHPAHGPGATREHIHGNSKYVFKRWHNRLEEYFPYTEFGIASVRNIERLSVDGLDVDFVEPEDEEPVRVVFVPKTQKTPRVIAIEPVCMQYMQQAICRWLMPRIESGRYTGGKVNFRDQSVNASIALSSSKDQRFATLDLSEASDRVSSDLVHTMLESVPLFREMVFACRSTKAELPDGTIVRLKKFASMGSALCFPIESMVFFCAIVSSRLGQRGLPATPHNVLSCTSGVYVYGDDIIVPVDEAPVACAALSSIGLKVNANKSFWTGKFRESCGTDAYDGTDVTPTYVRHEQPASKRLADAALAWSAMANQFYLKGYWGTVRKIREKMETIFGRIPHARRGSSGVHWVNYSDTSVFSRWNKDLMRFEQKRWVPRPVYRSDPLDGDHALLKCFGLIGSQAIDKKHLERSVARGKLALTNRWVPIY